MLESAEEFVQLRTSEHPDDYRRAAQDEASVDTWLDVIRRFPEMRFWVAQNKTVPPEILRLLAEDPDAKVRAMVARKRSLPPHILRTLAEDAQSPVRYAVIYNAKVPVEVLDQLSSDSAAFVADAARDRLRTCDVRE